MKNKLLSLIALIGVFFSCEPVKEESETSKKERLKTVFYNVENLFDTKHQLKKQDKDFTPDGLYRWTETKYQQKLSNIAKTLNELKGDVIGLAEIENKQVLNDLIAKITYADMAIIHYESYDIRGIDVALLYNPEKLSFNRSKEITTRLETGGYAGSRNILKAEFTHKSEYLIFYVNHWPSRRGGKEKNRIAYSKALIKELNTEKNANVIVMGDFNDTPSNTSIRNLVSEAELINPFEQLAKNGKGTCVFRNDWLMFDQIMVRSPKDYELKNYNIENLNHLVNSYGGKYKGYPLRSFSKNKFQKSGSSDHFPVSLEIITL